MSSKKIAFYWHQVLWVIYKSFFMHFISIYRINSQIVQMKSDNDLRNFWFCLNFIYNKSFFIISRAWCLVTYKKALISHWQTITISISLWFFALDSTLNSEKCDSQGYYSRGTNFIFTMSLQVSLKFKLVTKLIVC